MIHRVTGGHHESTEGTQKKKFEPEDSAFHLEVVSNKNQLKNMEQSLSERSMHKGQRVDANDNARKIRKRCTVIGISLYR